MQEELSKKFVESVQNEFKRDNAYIRASNRWSGQPRDEIEWRWMENDFLDARISDGIAQNYYSTYKNNLNYLYHTSVYYKQHSNKRKK